MGRCVTRAEQQPFSDSLVEGHLGLLCKDDSMLLCYSVFEMQRLTRGRKGRVGIIKLRMEE